MLQKSQVYPLALAVEKKQIFSEPFFCPRHILGVKITMENKNAHLLNTHKVYSPGVRH